VPAGAVLAATVFADASTAEMLIPKLWHAIRFLFAKIARLFGKETDPPTLEGVRVTLRRKSIGG